MTNQHIILLLALAILFIPSYAFAEKTEKSNLQHDRNYAHDKKNKTTIKVKKKIEYVPPLRGAPETARLVGMALRGENNNYSDFLLSVLAPTHTGLTNQKQPVLYWYISEAASDLFQLIEFVLVSDQSIQPVLRTQLSAARNSGIHHIQLLDYQITLKPNIEYTWSIAIIKNQQSRSQDIVSSGKIKFLPLRQKFKDSSNSPMLQTDLVWLSRSGYWYDALNVAINHLLKDINNRQYLVNLTTLLKQAKLEKIAKKLENEAKSAALGINKK